LNACRFAQCVHNLLPEHAFERAADVRQRKIDIDAAFALFGPIYQAQIDNRIAQLGVFDALQNLQQFVL